MTDEQIGFYRFGYSECRDVLVGKLREILKDEADSRSAVEDLVESLEAARKEEDWKAVQQEVPGITREEFEADLEASVKQIRETYYSPKVFLKPRLVK